MRDPFDYPLEPMTSQQVQAEQKERKARSSWTVTGIVILLAAFAIFGAIMLWMGKTSQEDLGGEPGTIQDGVYYVYGGGGFVLPGQVQVPIGICAYTPGQEPEVLVSATDYSLDPIFPSWDVNNHGLFFIDGNTDSLFRMDLTTREITQLYTRPPEAYQTDLFLFSLRLYDDHIILQRSNGQTSDYLTLDCKTGKVLDRSEAPPPKLTEPQPGTAGYEVQRLGLPEGTVTENGQEAWYAYLALADPWLFYVKQFPDENPDIAAYHSQLWAMDVNTQERHLVQDDIEIHQVVTDGNWFYNCGGDTDCYQIEYNDQGIPCGLTLIEERI